VARTSRARDEAETVASWAGRWLDAVPKQRSVSTRRHHEERVRAFVADFGDVELAGLDRAKLTRWLEAHPGHVGSVRSMLNDAESIGLLPPGSVPKVKAAPKRDPADVDLLEPEDLEGLVRCADRVLGPYGKVVYGPMLETAAWLGLGPDELWGLYPEDVRFEERQVTVRRRMDSRAANVVDVSSPRTIALLEPAERALRFLGVPDLQSVRSGEPIFRTQQGKPFAQRMLHYYWNPVRSAFVDSLPEGHWLVARTEDGHPLRFSELQHFFGARLGERDVSPADIADQMGMKDVRLVAARYTKQTDSVLRVLRAFDRAA
jgi:integrase